MGSELRYFFCKIAISVNGQLFSPLHHGLGVLVGHSVSGFCVSGAAVAAAGATVGTTIKYEPFKATDTLNKNGQSINVHTLLHCITSSPKYAHKSMEVS